MELKLFELDTKESAEEIIKKFSQDKIENTLSECLSFIKLWRNRVNNFKYKFICYREFNNDFLDETLKNILAHINKKMKKSEEVSQEIKGDISPIKTDEIIIKPYIGSLFD